MFKVLGMRIGSSLGVAHPLVIDHFVDCHAMLGVGLEQPTEHLFGQLGDALGHRECER